jgi:hypothetical protein
MNFTKIKIKTLAAFQGYGGISKYLNGKYAINSLGTKQECTG